MGSNKLHAIVVLIIAIYISSPIIFKYSTFIQRNLLFMNYVNNQYGNNLSHPEIYGIKCSRTLRIINPNDQIDKGVVEIGAWHILPETSLPSCHSTSHNNRTSIDDKIAFSDNRPIIFYVHGNGGTRGGDHRTRLYRRLAYEFDFHVITFDYRGFGDSSNLSPSRDGVTTDATFVYNWLLKQANVKLDRISVWGHSLGTAIATRMVDGLPNDKKPKKLILEAPFDSVGSAIREHPFSKPFRMIPFFEHFFIKPIVDSKELNFDSGKSIASLKGITNVMILHAEDDAILPINLGRKLFKEAVSKLGEKSVQLIEIDASYKLGHKLICNHDDTMLKVRSYIDPTIEQIPNKRI